MKANACSNSFAICMQSIRRVCIIAKNWIESILNAGRTTTNVQVQQLSNLIDASEKISVSGLAGSSYAFLVAAIFEKKKKTMVLVLDDKEEAAYIFNDLERLLPDQQVLFYPASYRRPYEIEEVDNANVMMRADALKDVARIKSQIYL